MNILESTKETITVPGNSCVSRIAEGCSASNVADRPKAMTITTGKGTAILKVIFLTLACSVAIVAHAADDKAKEQQEVRKMAHDTLQRLYK